MYQLAQANVAVMRGGLNDPVMAGFTAAFDPIARLADTAPGFVWRLKSGDGHQPVLDSTTPDFVINLSVWTDYPSLHAFVYRSPHGVMVKRRRDWFLPSPEPSTVLWWIPAGTHPTAAEALRRLAYLRRYGPTPRAFSLLHRFTPEGKPTRGLRR